MKFGFNRPVVSEEMFENDTHTYIHTYPRSTEVYRYYKLTCEPKGSGKLIMLVISVNSALEGLQGLKTL